MIKLMHAEYRHGYAIHCEFSDGMAGEYDLEPLLTSHPTPLTVPLLDQAAFRRFFLRSGALCWRNGLELDPQAIYHELKSGGKLALVSQAA